MRKMILSAAYPLMCSMRGFDMAIKNYLGRNFKSKRKPDKLTISKRSSLMSKIRSKNTKFEVDFIRQLRKETRIKFRTHVRKIKGNPDIVFPKQKICVFLDSDFWHGWQYPHWKHLLKNNFWRNKILSNRRRDRKVSVCLRRRRWKVIRIWEHEIKNNLDKAMERIKK